MTKYGIRPVNSVISPSNMCQHKCHHPGPWTANPRNISSLRGLNNVMTAAIVSNLEGIHMTDVLFKCWKCSKNLAVAAKRVGKTYPCPQCEQPLMIPEIAIFYNCPTCNWSLSSPSNHAGEPLSCPNCDTAIIVPSDTQEQSDDQDTITVRCINCNQGIAFDIDHYHELIGKNIDCPTCNRKIYIPEGDLKPNAEVVL